MNKLFRITLITLCILSLSGLAAAQVPEARPAAESPYAVAPAPAGRPELAVTTTITAATWVTVTSTADYAADGNSKRCSDVPADECTLRRAINQAYGAVNRPVAIVFDIPTSDSGYLADLGAWKITLDGTTAQQLRELYGQTILDGSTQPGGRDDGPKIIVDGVGNKNYGLILRNGENVVRGLAMQDYNTAHISVSSNDNTIEGCWFGLSDDGTTLSSGDFMDPEGGSGVALAAGASRNTIQDNVIAGFFGVAAAIRGDDNVFAANWIGTRADGTVPIPSQFPQHPCLVGAWEGGSGITVEGNRNVIGGPTPADGNVFAGLFLDATDQGPAIRVYQSGGHNVLQNNVVGLDAHGAIVGVCGRGFDFGSGPQHMRVVDNHLVETRLSAILMNGSSLNGNTLRGNLIWRATDWPPAQPPNPFPEDAIAYGPTVPSALRNFQPARVTSIDGTTVTGESGAGSPCPNCIVELFLDDTDGVKETLASLAVVTATADGTWTATLPAPLAEGQGLRTMSTVPDYFTIPDLAPGTTSNISELYAAQYQVFLPLVAK